MPEKLDIINIALSGLGRAEVSVETDAPRLNAYWPMFRPWFLGNWRWNGAESTEDFVLSTDPTDSPDVSWGQIFDLPTGCITIWSLNGDEQRPGDDLWKVSSVAFSGGGGGRKRVLLTDIATAKCEFSFDLDDADLDSLSPVTAMAMGWQLGLQQRQHFSLTPAENTAYQKEARDILSHALAVDGQQGTPRIRVRAPLVEARFAGTFRSTPPGPP
jgi:hypothetical protein